MEWSITLWLRFQEFLVPKLTLILVLVIVTVHICLHVYAYFPATIQFTLFSGFADFFFSLLLIIQAAKQARLEKFEIPAKIKLLPEPWTPESGLVTAALKIKRDCIRKAFSEDLAKLYA